MMDEQWMRRALRLARRGRGRTSPNPMVGAVLVKRGRVLGEGFHARAGEAHAEMIALEKAGAKAEGAILYLNLEPCTHYGRTPPCAPRVIKAGIKRAVIGMLDPNPRVKGRGVERLRRAGIEVKVGVLEEECLRLNEAFSKYIVSEEPFVTVKVASTLDGKIATRYGDSKWISGEASRRLVHRLRDEVDGILVGVDTIIRDDPFLTSRIRGGRDPYRVVLDSRLRTPEKSKVIEVNPSRTIIVTTESASKEKVEEFEKKGVRVLVLASKAGRVNLKTCLARLGELEMMSLMVEGGGRINGSFLDEGLIDKLLIFVSPKLIGDGHAPGIFGGRGFANLAKAVRIEGLRTRRVGEDILFEGYLGRGKEACLQES
jgi:diaminohydroxyphosphoribosylaminopyrimidine deaminase / 5-amino-6-(5-phosphoribosylamino)uracil reductase